MLWSKVYRVDELVKMKVHEIHWLLKMMIQNNKIKNRKSGPNVIHA